MADPVYTPVEQLQTADEQARVTRSPVRDVLLAQTGPGSTDWDLAYSKGDLSLTSGLTSVVQHARMRLGLFRGEMYNDTAEGTPYFQQVFAKGVDAKVLDQVFRDRILGTPGVVRLTSLQLVWNTVVRSLTVTWAAVSSNDQLIQDVASVPILGGGA